MKKPKFKFKKNSCVYVSEADKFFIITSLYIFHGKPYYGCMINFHDLEILGQEYLFSEDKLKDFWE